MSDMPIANASATIAHAEWSGPIPPPAALAAYQKIVPDAAERILKMAEEEAACRRKITESDHVAMNETRLAEIKNENATARRGQWMAFAFLFVLVGAVIFLALKRCTATACALCGIGVVGIVANLIKRK